MGCSYLGNILNVKNPVFISVLIEVFTQKVQRNKVNFKHFPRKQKMEICNLMLQSKYKEPYDVFLLRKNNLYFESLSQGMFIGNQ